MYPKPIHSHFALTLPGCPLLHGFCIMDILRFRFLHEIISDVVTIRFVRFVHSGFYDGERARASPLQMFRMKTMVCNG